MKLRKMMVILLVLCMALFTIGCGSSGGSDDDEDDTATWPVEYYMSVGGSPAPLMKAAPQTGTYKYLYFFKDGKYESGDLNNGTLTKTGEGTYTGGDPHNNVTLSLTGTFEGSTLSSESVAISSGSLTIAGKTFAKDGNGGGNTTSPYLVSFIYRSAPNIAYIDFIFDGSTYKYHVGNGTCTIGDGTDDVKTGYIEDWEGTFTGDPRIDGTVTVTGIWIHTIPPTETTEHEVVITSGVFTESGMNLIRQ